MPQHVDVSKSEGTGPATNGEIVVPVSNNPGEGQAGDSGGPSKKLKLPVVSKKKKETDSDGDSSEPGDEQGGKSSGEDSEAEMSAKAVEKGEINRETAPTIVVQSNDSDDDSDNDVFTNAPSTPFPDSAGLSQPSQSSKLSELVDQAKLEHSKAPQESKSVESAQDSTDEPPKSPQNSKSSVPAEESTPKPAAESQIAPEQTPPKETDGVVGQKEGATTSGHKRGKSSTANGISQWSHQHTVANKTEEEDKDPEEDEWQTMPAFAPYDMYDDDNKLIAREAQESDDEAAAYAGLGGAGKGYTRVQLDEDAQSATSMDENTQYLFKEANGTEAGMEDDEQRDAVSQMQATKDLLTEGQRIAYVGMTRLALSSMCSFAESMEGQSKGSKKETAMAAEAMKMWSQQMIVRLYIHMDISTAEQIMIEQLAEHGVEPRDLTPTLMQNARVKNPMAEDLSSPPKSPQPGSVRSTDQESPKSTLSPQFKEEEVASPPPPYVEHEGEDLPEVRTPSQLPTTQNIDIDLRWTVLCDLFLTLIADSVYDARSRVLLERVGEHMDVPWLEICRFEKRVTDALEMQQAAEKENWNEDEHKENRRKLALKKRYVMMGLATVGGGLVIGLSAGLMAPLIGAGLAAGFTTIGVAGTGGFLAGAGGAAVIASSAAASGGIIAVRAANRRTGAVKTFEYRPLHNNKRVNLIVTVSGWMTGKVDDVRLPYSTVDPVMGDIYSVLWEPEMLTSMGDTINILATEALTQGLQQVLGSTILIGLMAALQLPVVLTKLAYLIDNPWTVSLDRANSAGLILADSLIDRNLGTRPITFVGYSLGSRVIFSCLRELARKGAVGLVQNVYLFGSPIVAKKDEYLKARSVVAGRFVNGFARNDWILGYLFRLTSGGISRVAGLGPIEGIPGLENVDVTELVPGHMAYRTAMPRLLREVGWLVESDEFSEIEDPDPENHQQRQRELINEIEEARKEFEKQEQQAKGKFGFFSRKKKTVVEKKEWEMYQESKAEDTRSYNEQTSSNNGLLFDIDAIRAELASEHMEVKELKSTLPPMRLDLSSSPISPRTVLRETKSYDATSTLSKPTGSSSRNPSFTHLPRGTYSEGPSQEPEDDIQMSFDTAYSSPAHSISKPNSPAPPQPPLAEPTDRAATLQRPELHSSKTLPALPPMAMEHNAWADDEDEFQEKEMEMTFA